MPNQIHGGLYPAETVYLYTRMPCKLIFTCSSPAIFIEETHRNPKVLCMCETTLLEISDSIPQHTLYDCSYTGMQAFIPEQICFSRRGSKPSTHLQSELTFWSTKEELYQYRVYPCITGGKWMHWLLVSYLEEKEAIFLVHAFSVPGADFLCSSVM